VFWCFLADESAIKHIYNVKGASGIRPCMLCKNIVLRPPPNHDWLRSVAAPPAQWDRHTDQSFFEQVDLVGVLHGQTGVGVFDRLEKATGINFDPDGILFCLEIRHVLRPATGTMFDHMHCLTSQGIASAELGLFVAEIHGHGVSLEQVDSFNSMFVLPKKFGTWRADFLQARADPATGKLRIFASEALTLMVLMQQFVLRVLLPSGQLPRHCRCFLLLAEIIRHLQRGDEACQHSLTLDRLIAQHAALATELYPGTVRPKLHYLAHIPDQLRRMQINMSCYTMERKHRDTKRAAASTFRNFERTLIGNRLNRMVHVAQDAVVFQACRLHNPRQADWALTTVKQVEPLADEVLASSQAVHPVCGWLCRGDLLLVRFTDGDCVGIAHSFLSVRSGADRITFHVILSVFRPVSADVWSRREQEQLICELAAVQADLVYSHEELECVRIVRP
jgi:hypothetical protein